MLDNQVKSNFKRNGRRIWKEYRAVLDTGCTADNWVALEVIEDLRFDDMLALTKSEAIPAQLANGTTVEALGAIDLTWHGIPGRQVRNCSRNFKMRFLVTKPATGEEELPFQILVGSASLWRYKILGKPNLGIERARNGLKMVPKVLHNILLKPQGPGGNSES
jgi:hypothetical protein